ncbi:MFS transporter [Lentzea kentuckyensis]|uniref:MFS transporter n=1 Tax=Lentzea kentuckyensis TaxID=360086 RepID=UPI000A36CC7C|nr:MFS transporter [Lentzea kentuckyensis]
MESAAEQRAPKQVTEHTENRGRRSLIGRRLYIFSALIDTIGGGLWMPVSLIFFIDGKGLPAEQVGLALTIGGIIGLVAAPNGGGLIDKRGPAFIAVIANVLCGSVFLFYTVVDQVWQIALLSAVFAGADRLFWTANAPLLERLVPAGQALDRVLGAQNVARIVGLGVGAGLSGLFIGNPSGLNILGYANGLSYVLAATITLVAVLVAGVATSRIAMPKAESLATPWRRILADRPYLMLCLIQVQFGLAARSFVVILPVVAIHTLGGPSWLPGVSVIVANGLLALIQAPVIRLSERTSRLWIINVSAIAFVGSFLLLVPGGTFGASAAVPIIVAVAVLTAVAEAGFAPPITAAASLAAPQELKGRYSAVLQTSWGLGNVLAPALFTSLYAVSNSVLWLFMALLLLAVVPIANATAKRLPPGCLTAG